jgi:hypothetical protein
MHLSAKLDFIANRQTLCSAQLTPAPHLKSRPGIQQLMVSKFRLCRVDAIRIDPQIDCVDIYKLPKQPSCQKRLALI